MAIDNQNARKAMMGQADADILDITDEGVPGDGQRAVKIHMVRTVTVVDRRDQHARRKVNLSRRGGCAWLEVRAALLKKA